jgi:hypothetical protein
MEPPEPLVRFRGGGAYRKLLFVDFDVEHLGMRHRQSTESQHVNVADNLRRVVRLADLPVHQQAKQLALGDVLCSLRPNLGSTGRDILLVSHARILAHQSRGED